MTELAPASSNSMMMMKPASSHQVRAKFFNVIGIESRGSPTGVKDVTMVDAPSSQPPALNKEWVHPRAAQVTTFREDLKYDKYADKMYAPKAHRGATATTISKKSRKQKKSLSFDEKVEVVPIPMRNEYSNRVRSRLWSNAMEIQENAARNTIEFAAEGWDWRTVLEDERMYVCVATAELIHPCHYEQFYQHGFR